MVMKCNCFSLITGVAVLKTFAYKVYLDSSSAMKTGLTLLEEQKILKWVYITYNNTLTCLKIN